MKILLPPPIVLPNTTGVPPGCRQARRAPRQPSGIPEVFGDGGPGDGPFFKKVRPPEIHFHTKVLPPESPLPRNLCCPDGSKSCAACCGLYNVRDGTRSTLHQELEFRTRVFESVPRTPEGIDRFRGLIGGREYGIALDPEIHVCQFTGFVDPGLRLAGCMLHPAGKGNAGLDLRGLCHYGSLACKSFYCPSWEELPDRHAYAAINAVDDWHLYGLVVTDLDFVLSLFAIIEELLGRETVLEVLDRPIVRQAFSRLLQWKDSWPYKGASKVRRSRYYCKRQESHFGQDLSLHVERIVDCLKFTFDMGEAVPGADRFVLGGAKEFVEVYVASERLLP